MMWSYSSLAYLQLSQWRLPENDYSKIVPALLSKSYLTSYKSFTLLGFEQGKAWMLPIVANLFMEYAKSKAFGSFKLTAPSHLTDTCMTQVSCKYLGQVEAFTVQNNPVVRNKVHQGRYIGYVMYYFIAIILNPT